MGHFIDITGKKYGKLTVIEFAGRIRQPSGKICTMWKCRCDCGNYCTIRADSLKMGCTQSCGCLKQKQDKINLKKNHRHKMSGTRLYGIWQKMKDRCYNSNVKCYPRYGGRGIKMCYEWLKPDNFIQWSLENGYSNKLTIDRIDNNGNYEPSNCRWITNKEQCRNRRSNIMVEYNNKKMTLIELAEQINIPYKTLYMRYKRGKRNAELIKLVEKSK